MTARTLRCRKSLASLAACSVLLPVGACRSADPRPRTQENEAANIAAEAENTDSPQEDPNAASAETEPPAKALGSGVPDETNGVCRLYAPQLPYPECCPYEYGFDAVRAAEICGLPAYLGESLHQTCGYHFRTADNDEEVFFRLSAVAGDTVEAATRDHDRVARAKLNAEGFQSEPVPGVEGAYWSRLAEQKMNWAFIPGWDVVRRVTWQDGACSREAMPKLLAELIAAKQPAADAPRQGLLPTARK